MAAQESIDGIVDCLHGVFADREGFGRFQLLSPLGE